MESFKVRLSLPEANVADSRKAQYWVFNDPIMRGVTYTITILGERSDVIVSRYGEITYYNWSLSIDTTGDVDDGECVGVKADEVEVCVVEARDDDINLPIKIEDDITFRLLPGVDITLMVNRDVVVFATRI